MVRGIAVRSGLAHTRRAYLENGRWFRVSFLNFINNKRSIGSIYTDSIISIIKHYIKEAIDYDNIGDIECMWRLKIVSIDKKKITDDELKQAVKEIGTYEGLNEEQLYRYGQHVFKVAK